MSENETREEVTKIVNDDEATTPPAEKSESVPPVNTETKQEDKAVEEKAPPVEPEKADTLVKLEEQVSNLNTALSHERGQAKEDKKKVAELQKQLEETRGLMDRMKSVFTPESEKEEPISYKEGLTKEELLQILEERDQKTKEQEFEKQRSQQIEEEIKELETTYNGKDGGIKYDDKEVLAWQKDNNKLYLTPKEAFAAMKQKEIIDYEIKKALSGKAPVENVETPGGGPTQHEPKETLPKNEQETRQAVLEAMNKIEVGGDID